MRKILAIAWKEVYVQFTDRNFLLITIVTPLALSTIIGLAFSRVGNNDLPIEDIPVAVLNLDQGGEFGLNFGSIYLSALIPAAAGDNPSRGIADCADPRQDATPPEAGDSGDGALARLTEAEAFDAARADSLIASREIEAPPGEPGSPVFLEAAVRRAVEAGIYRAAVIIPENFTQRAGYLPGVHPQMEETGILVYSDGANPISGGIVHSIVSAITNQIVAGNITLAANLEALAETADLPPAGGAVDLRAIAACAFQPGPEAVRLVNEEVEGFSSDDVTLFLFVRFGSAQAMFFGLFAAGFGVLSFYDERRNWTLQRLLISPTPRSSVLAGKLAGVFLGVIFQVSILLMAMTVVASVVVREPVSIWGDDLGKTILVTLAASFAVTGFGMLVAGVVRTPEQGQVFIPILSIGLAMLGGSFGFLLPEGVSKLSLIYWGRTAYESLAFNGGDVALNILVLVGQGAVFYLIGLYVFNRHFNLDG